MKAYSLDLRERVVAAVMEQKTPRKKAALLFQISLSSVGLFVRTSQAGKSLVARHPTGRPRLLGPKETALVETLAEAEPGWGLERWRQELACAHGIALSCATLWRALRAKGWKHKKKAWPQANATRASGRRGARRPPPN